MPYLQNEPGTPERVGKLVGDALSLAVLLFVLWIMVRQFA